MNKEKLLKWLTLKQIDFDTCQGVGFVFEEEWRQLTKFVENGEFDNE